MSTLRHMSAARDLPPAELLGRLELDPSHHDLDAPLRPRVEALYTMVLEGTDLEPGVCQCEHESHFRPTLARARHAYLAWPAGPREAMYVGRVCDECATTHLVDLLLPLAPAVPA